MERRLVEIILQICPNCERLLGKWRIKSGKINTSRNKISILGEIILNSKQPELHNRNTAMEKSMLLLTKMDTRKILVNARSIQTVESNPDTVIILSGGRKLLVKESLEEIWEMIQEG